MTNQPSTAFRRVAATALACAALLGAAACGSEPKAAAAQDRPELQQTIQEIADAGFAGVQLRVHDRRGEWTGSAGVAELGSAAKPPTDGQFWTGSSIKTVTATMVLQLVAEGRIGLDAPVADHLPELGLDRRITTRMLLQHTSGLFNYTGEYYDDGTMAPGIPATGKEWLDNRFHSYQPEELVRLALSKPARFEPGTDFSYANTNYTLALLLIEKVTGNSYAAEMQRRILDPLGMRDTKVPGNLAELPGPHAHGYFRYQDAGEWKTVDVARQNLSLLAGAGDLISTTEDLHRFFAALNGGKLLPAPLLAEMRTPNPKLGYGLGIFVQDVGPKCGGTVYHHNGSPPAGYGTMMYSSPDGSVTMTASLTMGDAAMEPTKEFPKATQQLIEKVFCGGGN